jgi:hypothetical protein
MFSNFFPKSCHLWDNEEKYGTGRQFTDDNIIRRMRTACWINKDTHTHTHTHTECVAFIVFPLQQLLHERPSLLHYTYFASLVQHGLCFFSGILFNAVFIASQIVLIICCFPTYIVSKVKGDAALHIWYLFWYVTVHLNYVLALYMSKKLQSRLSFSEPQILPWNSRKWSEI